MDMEMVNLLGTLIKTKHLNEKDMALILRLQANGYGGVRLASLIKRVNREKLGIDKLMQRVEKRPGAHADSIVVSRILLRATTISPKAVYTILNTEASFHLSLLERDFCKKVKDWCAVNLEAEAMAVDPSCALKRGRSGSEDGDGEETMPEPPDGF